MLDKMADHRITRAHDREVTINRYWKPRLLLNDTKMLLIMTITAHYVATCPKSAAYFVIYG